MMDVEQIVVGSQLSSFVNQIRPTSIDPQHLERSKLERQKIAQSLAQKLTLRGGGGNASKETSAGGVKSQYTALDSSNETQFQLDEFDRVHILLKLQYLDLYETDISASHFEATKLLGYKNMYMKRKCYLFAETNFHPNSDAALMSANIISQDITFSRPISTLPLNTLSLIFSLDLLQITYPHILKHSLTADPEIKHKFMCILPAYFKASKDDPSAHLFDMAKTLSIDDKSEKLQIFASVLLELLCDYPDVKIPFTPALYKILKLKFDDEYLAVKLIKSINKICQNPQNDTLLRKMRDLIAEKLKSKLKITVLVEIVQFFVDFPHMFAKTEIIIDLVEVLKKYLEDQNPAVIFAVLNCVNNLANKYLIGNNGLFKLVSSHLQSTSQLIVLAAIEFTTKKVDSSTIVPTVSSMIKIMKTTTSRNTAETIFKHIIRLCSKNDHTNLKANQELFEWYSLVLMDLAQMPFAFQFVTLNNQILYLINSEIDGIAQNIVSNLLHLVQFLNKSPLVAGKCNEVTTAQNMFFVDVVRILCKNENLISDKSALIASILCKMNNLDNFTNFFDLKLCFWQLVVKLSRSDKALAENFCDKLKEIEAKFEARRPRRNPFAFNLKNLIKIDFPADFLDDEEPLSGEEIEIELPDCLKNINNEDFLVFKDTHDAALDQNPIQSPKNQFLPAKDSEIFIRTSNLNPQLAPDFLKSKSEDNLKKSPYTAPTKPNTSPKIIPTSNIMTSDKFFELNKDALVKPKTKFCDASKELNLAECEGSSKDLKTND